MMKSSGHTTVVPRSQLSEERGDRPPAGSADLTIDEVARAAGMTVRNVRAHQSRGLLPPPVVRGRTGYYDPDHVARLELIREMQADGFNLEAIKRVLARTAPGAAAPTLEFDREVRRPWYTETPEVVTDSELATRFGEGRAELTQVAVNLGLLVPVGEGSYEVPSPSLLAAAQELTELGMPVEAVLGVARAVSRDAESIAQRFVDLFVEQIWQPFEDAGRPDVDWQRISNALERCRPIAMTAVDGLMRRSLEVVIEQAYGRAMRHGTPQRRGRGRQRRV